MATVGLSSAGARARSRRRPSEFDGDRGRGDLAPTLSRPFRYRRATAAGDAFTALIAFVAIWLPGGPVQAPSLAQTLAVSTIAVGWPCVLTVKTARADRLFAGGGPYGDVLRALAALIAVVAIVCAVLDVRLLGGPFLAVSAILVAGSLATRVYVRRRLRELRQRGRATRRTLVVGPASGIAGAVDRYGRDGEHPLAVVAACVEDDGTAPPATVPVVGRIDKGLPGHDDAVRDEALIRSVRESVLRVRARAVCVTPGSEFTGDRLRALSWTLGDLGVDLVTDLGLSDVALHRMGLGSMGSGVLLHVRHARPAGLRRLAKALTDRLLAAVLLLVLSPLMLSIATAVRLSGPGPVVYRQVRVGQDGLFFTMMKFRTMHLDADLRRAELMGDCDGDGPMFKMRDDPRITRVGRVLRRYSLDELPQLVNVVRGEMSLVGPRPALPEEVAAYDTVARRRLRAVPGMTGLWQVSGRSNLSWGETVRLDLRYVDNWSYSEDLQLLGRTAGAVVRSTGAY
ncbi:exopolysaccharide biosynthesis polyprenyl glycosylphosphotransferase [Jiangella asiatica]|uniref:Exopolysaccharide biosynthesis polyprenyl glycosylphosphotransferase n=1 Tax=Jiangella asiatica TaxID=2530372 RepID=A0A4R5D4Q6_9ACTN|nr:exopolysaccharide biosynthesis polyprenyl glycosylphosphotransferase [Jiangella asiatica]TDE07467.1 exopolysaccharide biosynthesis polyprenyl glycosylphosphotransferase [Jiangella asiatica]